MSEFDPLPPPFERISNHEYDADRPNYLSSHKLIDFIKCPQLYYRTHVTRDMPSGDSDAFRIGRAAHCLILEGHDAFKRSFAVGGPINPKTNKHFGSNTKAFHEWVEEQNAEGRDFITDDENLLIQEMHAGVLNNEMAFNLLGLDSAAELTVRTELEGMPVQSRFDLVARGTRDNLILVDLKTCKNLDWFERDARTYYYLHQLAFYDLVYAKAGDNMGFDDAFIIGVEKEAPYRAGVWRCDIGELQAIACQLEKHIQHLKTMLETKNEAPCWPTGFEGIRSLTL